MDRRAPGDHHVERFAPALGGGAGWPSPSGPAVPVASWLASPPCRPLRCGRSPEPALLPLLCLREWRAVVKGSREKRSEPLAEAVLFGLVDAGDAELAAARVRVEADPAGGWAATVERAGGGAAATRRSDPAPCRGLECEQSLVQADRDTRCLRPLLPTCGDFGVASRACPRGSTVLPAAGEAGSPSAVLFGAQPDVAAYGGEDGRPANR